MARILMPASGLRKPPTGAGSQSDPRPAMLVPPAVWHPMADGCRTRFSSWTSHEGTTPFVATVEKVTQQIA